MRCARPAPPRITKLRIRCGSSLSPPVTLATAPPVVEPACRSAGRPVLLHEREPPGCYPGALFSYGESAKSGARTLFRRGSLDERKRRGTAMARAEVPSRLSRRHAGMLVPEVG